MTLSAYTLDSRRTCFTSLGQGVVIVLAGLIAYSNSFSGPFVFDDTVFLTESKLDSLSPPGGLTNRGLVHITFALNYAVHGLETWGYHATNLAIHIVAALILWGTMAQALSQLAKRGYSLPGSPTNTSFAIALLWCVHPLTTQAVTYTIQRAESLMGLFYIATLSCLMRGAGSQRSAGWYVGSIICCWLGMMCKPVIWIAPIVLFPLDRALLSDSFRETLRKRWWVYVGYWAPGIVLAPALARILFGEGSTAGLQIPGLTPVSYAQTQAEIILYYIRLAICPLQQCFDYLWPVSSDPVRILVSVATVLSLLGVTAWGVWRGRPWAALGVWFFGVLAPTSSFVPVQDLAVEHRMYLPLIAVLAAVVLLVQQGLNRFGPLVSRALLGTTDGRASKAQRRKRREAATSSSDDSALTSSRFPICQVLLLTIGTVVLAGLTYQRNEVYRSAASLWLDTLRKAPANYRAHANYGRAILLEGDAKRAALAQSVAIKLKPNYGQAYFNRGRALLDIGAVPLAVKDFDKAIELKDEFGSLMTPELTAQAYSNRGSALMQLERVDEAIADFTAALEIRPRFTEALFNRALAQYVSGQYDKAVEDFSSLIEAHPFDLDAYRGRAACYEKLGEATKAAADRQKAQQLADR